MEDIKFLVHLDELKNLEFPGQMTWVEDIKDLEYQEESEHLVNLKNHKAVKIKKIWMI